MHANPHDASCGPLRVRAACVSVLADCKKILSTRSAQAISFGKAEARRCRLGRSALLDDGVVKGSTLMTVVAHPDDDAYGIAGTVVLHAHDPAFRFVLVHATDGGGGEIRDEFPATSESLGRIRMVEDERACSGGRTDSGPARLARLSRRRRYRRAVRGAGRCNRGRHGAGAANGRTHFWARRDLRSPRPHRDRRRYRRCLHAVRRH